MANAQRDQNNVPTLLGILASNGTTTVAVCADPNSNGLCVEDNTTGDDMGPANALRDQNSVPTLLAVSSADGVTPVTVYTDSDGYLLIDSA